MQGPLIKYSNWGATQFFFAWRLTPEDRQSRVEHRTGSISLVGNNGVLNIVTDSIHSRLKKIFLVLDDFNVIKHENR